MKSPASTSAPIVKGLKCPTCNLKQHSVLESRATYSGTVRRKRECFNGHVFITEESVVAALPTKQTVKERRQIETQVLKLIADNAKYGGQSDPRYNSAAKIAAQLGISKHTVRFIKVKSDKRVKPSKGT
jgi:hypothetical protein